MVSGAVDQNILHKNTKQAAIKNADLAVNRIH